MEFDGKQIQGVFKKALFTSSVSSLHLYIFCLSGGILAACIGCYWHLDLSVTPFVKRIVRVLRRMHEMNKIVKSVS